MCTAKDEIAETKIDRLIRAVDRLSAALEAQQAKSVDFFTPAQNVRRASGGPQYEVPPLARDGVR